MKLSKIKAIYRKEILDLLRDKKTLIMMVLVPLVLYPLIFIAAILITSSVVSNMQSSEYDISIVCDETASFDTKELIDVISDTEDGLDYNIRVVDVEAAGEYTTSNTDGNDVSDVLYEALLNEDIDSYIVVRDDAGSISFEVYYLSSVTDSSTVSDMLEDKLALYEERVQENILNTLGLDSSYIMNPVKIGWNDESNTEEKLGSVLGSILPFLLISSILMGAVYPAIDTTAGEKERGTLETLLTLPVRNDELIMGKFLAVASVALVSASLNLISMGIMSGFLLQLMDSSESTLSFNLTSFIPAIVIVVLCVAAFALFMSAITMCITTFAKSFKEANNYVTPLLLVVMLTAYVGFIPNIELTSFLAAVPVVNICLLIAQLLSFKYNFYMILIVLVSNVAYAALMVWLLAGIYNSEDVLFGESGVNLQIFGSRRDMKKGGVPNFADAVVVAAVTMLLVLYIGTIVQLKLLMTGLFITQLIIIGVPVLAAWYTKKDFAKTFSLRKPKILSLTGAVLLEIGTFALVMLISGILTAIWPSDAESVSSSFELLLKDADFLPALFVMALAPAVCEEALFRGYLFAAARGRFKVQAAILMTAALFGVYHLSVVKFFTTGILGIAFAYVVYKTGSIFHSSLMHFINNAFSVVVMYYGTQLEKSFPVLFSDSYSGMQMAGMLAVSIVFGTAGLLLINISSCGKTCSKTA